MSTTLKWTIYTFLYGAVALGVMACHGDEPSGTTVVNLHAEAESQGAPTEKESSPKEVVNVSFKGGTEEAKNLAVVFDLKNGQKLDGQRIPPVRVDEHNPTLGRDDAPVTWVIFGGWECPFSNRLPPVIKALHKAYPERLRIVFKHVTPSHKEVGTIAARRVVMSARETFWKEGMELLAKGPLTETILAETAGFPPLTGDQEKEARIRLDMDQELASSLNIRSTPQSFINGYRITGVKPLETFKDIIETELKRSEGQENP